MLYSSFLALLEIFKICKKLHRKTLLTEIQVLHLLIFSVDCKEWPRIPEWLSSWKSSHLSTSHLISVCDAGDTCLFSHFPQTSLKLVLFTRYTDHLIGMHFSILPLPHLSHWNLETVKNILSVGHACNFSDLVFLLQSFQYQVLWHCHRVFWLQTFWPNLKIIKYCKISFYVSCIYTWAFLTHFSLTACKWASEVSEIARTWKQPKCPLTEEWIKKMWHIYTMEHSVQFSSVAQSYPTLCDPMNCSTPGLPVHHKLPEFTQTHVHRVSDAIQPSHPLSSPSPLAPNPSQHQSLFQWVNSAHEVAKILEFQL